MNRNHPLAGSGQPHPAQNQANGQPPPPPAGPAPPLPASAAYANYGYGPVAPARNANVNATGSPSQQGNWQNQWQSVQTPGAQHQVRPQQPQYQQQPVTQYPTYHAPPQTYAAHQPQQPVQPPQAYPAYPQPTTPAYNYSPGAYNPAAPQMTAPQPGPPNKKARYNQPAAPVPAPAPMHYPPPAQSYGWQGPAPNQHTMSAPQPSVPTNATGWGPPNGGLQANRGRGGMSAMSSRGRPSPQNHGGMRQGSPAQPRNNFTPPAPYNARPGGPQMHSALPPQTANMGQAFRRPSSSSSGQGAGQNRNTSTSSKGGFSSQNTIPISGSRGAAGQKGKAPGTNGSAPVASKVPGGPAAGKHASGQGASASDNGITPNCKRAHTDFRVLSIEVKELSWCWALPTISDPVETSAKEEPSDAVQLQKSEPATPSVVSTPSPDPPALLEEEKTNANGDTEATDNIEVVQETKDNGEHSTSAPLLSSETEVAKQPGLEAEVTKPAGVSEASSVGQKSETLSVQAATSIRDATRFRICFSAMATAAPENAPTGPKAEQSKSTTSAAIPSKPKDDDTVSVKQEPEQPEPSTLDTSTATPDNDMAFERLMKEVLAKAEEADARTQHEKLEEPVAEPTPTIKEEADESHADPSADTSSAGPALSAAAETDTNASLPAMDPVSKTESDAGVKAESDADDGKSNKGTVSRASSEKSGSGRFKKSSAPAKGPAPLSPNRVQVTYADTRKRLAIDADVIKSMKISRSENWVEIVVQLSSQAPTDNRRDDFNIAKGTVLEARGKDQENYSAVTLQEIEATWSENDTDPTGSRAGNGDDHGRTESPGRGPASELPPFFRLSPSSEVSQMTVVVHLDPESSFPEPTWLKKGDTDEILASLQRAAHPGKKGGGTSLAVSQHVWSDKIEVVDPDPPPSFEGMLRDWVDESFIGGQEERQSFVDDFLANRSKAATAAGADTTVQDADVSVEPRATDEDGDKESRPNEVETDAERDLRIAKGYAEIAARLVKGERAVTSGKTTPTLGRSVAGSAFADFGEGTNFVSWGGAAMLSLFDLGLRQCAPLLEAGGDNAAVLAQTWRNETGKVLMELPSAMVTKAIDLTWKDVMERQRRGSGSVQPGPSTGGAKSSGGRNHGPHNRASGAGGNKRKR